MPSYGFARANTIQPVQVSKRTKVERGISTNGVNSCKPEKIINFLTGSASGNIQKTKIMEGAL